MGEGGYPRTPDRLNPRAPPRPPENPAACPAPAPQFDSLDVLRTPIMGDLARQQQAAMPTARSKDVAEEDELFIAPLALPRKPARCAGARPPRNGPNRATRAPNRPRIGPNSDPNRTRIGPESDWKRNAAEAGM